jgi:hypothetical protein
MLNDIVGTVTDPNLGQIEAAVITALSGIIVAILGIFGARKFTRPRRIPMYDPDEGRHGHRSLLSSYSGDQNEFIALVIKDSESLHARLDKNDQTISDMDSLIKEMKKERTQIIGAFGRYIQKLALAWGSGGKMPYPDTEDMALLEDTLPADWRRRRN